MVTRDVKAVISLQVLMDKGEEVILLAFNQAHSTYFFAGFGIQLQGSLLDLVPAIFADFNFLIGILLQEGM